MKLKNIIILQNKIDLVKEKEAASQYEEILSFIRGARSIELSLRALMLCAQAVHYGLARAAFVVLRARRFVALSASEGLRLIRSRHRGGRRADHPDLRAAQVQHRGHLRIHVQEDSHSRSRLHVRAALLHTAPFHALHCALYSAAHCSVPLNCYFTYRHRSSPQLIVIRSFDVNKPGEEVEHLKGGVAGGSILKGVLKIGDEIEVRPGIVTKDKAGRVKCIPIFSRIISLYTEHNDLKFAVPGGLIGVGTKIDPTLTRADRSAAHHAPMDDEVQHGWSGAWCRRKAA
jgi:hypothetical protein